MRENQIEKRLVRDVKNQGGMALKFVSPGLAGMPDRIVLLPNGMCGFVEVKAAREKPRLLQEARHRMLCRLGYKVYILNDVNQIPHILREMGGDAE